MIGKIASLMAAEIDSLAWVETIGGLAKATKKDDTVIPTCLNAKTTCDTSDLKILIPNSKKKSVLFFENTPATIIQNTANFVEFSVDLTLLVWVNYLLLSDGTMTEPSRLVFDVLSTMPNKILNTQHINAIRIDCLGFNESKDEVFNKYTFNEEESQYITYPYDCFSITFNVIFRVSKGCL